MRGIRQTTLAITLACAGLTGTADLDSQAFLRTHGGFSADDLKKLERGEVVAHSIGADGSEVALAAATMIGIPIDFYLQRFQAIESFKRSQEVLQIGRFSAVPSPSDLRTLTLDAGELSALRQCRSGRCDVKLDGTGITDVARAPDVEAAFRSHLAGYAARYLREGNGALIEYHDERTPRPLARELSKIVARSPYLPQISTGMHTAVAAFDGTLPDGLEQFLYWSKEKPPGKAIVSLTHAIVQPETQGTAVVATKQLYASHYMTASLGLTVLVNRDTPDTPRTMLIYVNRTRVDVFDGVLGRVKRPIVRSRARGGAEQMLERLRTRLESEYRAAR